MGDRTYVKALVRKCDAEKFEAITRFKRVSQYTCRTELYTLFEEPEADYAPYDELNRCGEEGLVFYGYHGSGYDYSAIRFASTGDGETYYAEKGLSSNTLCVDVNNDGEINERQLEHVRNFLKQEQLAKLMIVNPLWEWEVEIDGLNKEAINGL